MLPRAVVVTTIGSFAFAALARAATLCFNSPRSKRVLVGYGGEKFLFGKVVRGKGDGGLALLDSTGMKTEEITIVRARNRIPPVR